MVRVGRDNNHRYRALVDTNNSKAQLERIYVRDQGICQLCQLPCLREDASRDHIIELRFCTPEQARDDNNMRLAHKLCNNKRSNSPNSSESIVILEPKRTPSPLTHTMADQLRTLGLFEIETDSTIAKWYENL